MSEGVTEVSERGNKGAQRSAWANWAGRSKWTSERCERAREQTSERPSTSVCILGCSGPQCWGDLILWEAFKHVPLALLQNLPSSKHRWRKPKRKNLNGALLMALPFPYPLPQVRHPLTLTPPLLPPPTSIKNWLLDVERWKAFMIFSIHYSLIFLSFWSFNTLRSSVKLMLITLKFEYLMACWENIDIYLTR